MRQRVMIAMAIANDPRGADRRRADHRARRDRAGPDPRGDPADPARAAARPIVLITHDLGVIARVADRVQVMYAGRVVERGIVHDLFDHSTHPYTRGLLNSLPALGRERLTPIPGAPPNMLRPPSGCAFRPRCPLRRGRVRGRPARAAAGRRSADGLRAGRRAGGGRGAVTATIGAAGGPVLEVTDLVKNFTVKSLEGVRAVKSHRAGGVGRVVHASKAARRSVWWGSPARASRRSAAASCA